MGKRIKSIIPKGFLWKLTFLNVSVIVLTIGISSFALYNTACFLVEGMGDFGELRQQQFNATLLQYLWTFSFIGIMVGSVFHFYFTKKLIRPVRQLIESTKQMKMGEYPEAIKVDSHDEIGELVQQYNGLTEQLQMNESHRQKLVADLAHEFRTPLSNLNGYLLALKNDVIQGDRDLFQSLYDESNRLTTMIEQLDQLKEWDFTATQTMTRKQTIDIAGEIEQCVAMFEWKLIEANIQAEVDVAPQLINIYVEGIRQVLSNVIDNAISYYSGSGKISIKGELLESVYHISVTGPSHFIPESKRDHIFERFNRLDDSRSRDTGGTGLGLAIARVIIRQHGGDIGVIPKDENNTFWFTIPYGETVK